MPKTAAPSTPKASSRRRRARTPMPTTVRSFGGRSALTAGAQTAETPAAAPKRTRRTTTAKTPVAAAPKRTRRATTTKASAPVVNVDGLFMEDAMIAIGQITAHQAEFTSDDLWPLLSSPSEPRALGSAMRVAQARRLCEPTGRYRPSTRSVCHSRPVQIWRSVPDAELLAA